MAITGTTVDWATINEELRGIDKKIAEEQRVAQIAEQQRIDQMVCPICKSNNKFRHMLTENNGIFGPGYSSHVILDFYICNDCGVHYSDLNKKK